jgi:hypothetical protein
MVAGVKQLPWSKGGSFLQIGVPFQYCNFGGKTARFSRVSGSRDGDRPWVVADAGPEDQSSD